MSVFGKIFTWWNGATIGTAWFSWRKGREIGRDAAGNVYFETSATNDVRRRWVMYAGPNDASRVSPEWHGWLHQTIDAPPAQALPPPRTWEQAPLPNLTGTPQACRPAGALEAGGVRAAATGDYEAWSPN